MKKGKITILTILVSILFAACLLNGDVAVTGVSVDDDFSLTVGGTKQLTAVVSPSDATITSVTWVSSDDDVATVSSSGLVTAIAVGTADITVTTTDGSFTDTVTATVTAGDIAVTGVLLGDDVTIGTTKTRQFTATATITVTTEDGSFTDTLEVTVILYVASTGLSILDSENGTDIATLSVDENSSTSIYVEVLPAGATDKSFTCTLSDDTKVDVTVYEDNQSITIQGVSPGTTTLTVTSNDNESYSDIVEITVNADTTAPSLGQVL